MELFRFAGVELESSRTHIGWGSDGFTESICLVSAGLAVQSS